MGNQPSSAANYQLTPEQYQQYQYFLHQQQMQRQRPQYKMGHAQPPAAPQPRPPQQQQPQMASRTTVSASTNLQSNFIQQQQQRSQVRPTNQRMDAKIIPNLQQKSGMPSVENSYQSAYNQRLNDNFNNMGNAQPPSMNGMRNLHTPQQQYPTYGNEPTRSKPVPESKPKQQSFFNNLNNEINEIEHLKYNPEQILGLSEGVAHSELEIKKAYRNLALKYHPDKGGSEEIFKILTKAYLYLLKKTNGENYVEKSFMDLKGSFEKEHPSAPSHQAARTSSDDFNVKNFNKIFEDNRLENEDFDYGYGDWKTEDTSEEPKKIFNDKFTADVFNSVFNELKKNNTTTQDVIVYEDPKPLTVSNRFGYSDVDYKRSDDYSKEYDIQDGSSRQGIYYMDYKRAYTETTLINPEAVRSKQQFKNMEEAQQAREKQDFTMTDEERAYFADKKRREDEQEEQRLSRLRGRDNRLEQHSNTVNRLLMTNQPQSTRTLEYKK
jgi:curved DNA-binding protein CbpA